MPPAAMQVLTTWNKPRQGRPIIAQDVSAGHMREMIQAPHGRDRRPGRTFRSLTFSLRLPSLTISPMNVFITGGTGYVGRPLISDLLQRGHQLRALVRAGSESRVPSGCQAVVGNALDANSYRTQIPPADTFVQLVGVSHPSPAKAAQFRSIDLASASGAIDAAKEAHIQHFVYLSVAHPAPVMKAYIEVRAACEAMIRESGMHATILRPWYVLGPGHRWPYLLLPLYKFAELFSSTREGAQRLGLVTLEQMITALTFAVENPVRTMHVLTVPEIRAAQLEMAGAMARRAP